ncbi:hypothetical protein D3C75_1279520 [compost metagenome]
MSHRPMIDDDGSEIVRAPLSISEVVTPWKKPLIKVNLQKWKSPAFARLLGVGTAHYGNENAPSVRGVYWVCSANQGGATGR